jgi:hypothetical protein
MSPTQFERAMNEMYELGKQHANELAEERGFWRGVEEMHKLQTTPTQTQPRIH